MGVDTTKWTVDQYLAAAVTVGLPAGGFVPASLVPLAKQVAQSSVPTGAPPTFPVVAEASLRARGIIYFKSNPGDCGSPASLDLENAQLAGAAGNIATGIASMAGAALPGIGVAVQAIQQIFAAHAAAVANEQATICKVAGVINAVIPFYDAKVRSGAISPSTAYYGMQTYFQQVIGLLSGIEKTCNAACVYIGVLQAHSTFVESYYPAIAPMQVVAHAPGAPPSGLGTTPGGVIQVGGAPASANAPVTVAGVSISTNELILAGVALLAILVLSSAAK